MCESLILAGPAPAGSFLAATQEFWRMVDLHSVLHLGISSHSPASKGASEPGRAKREVSDWKVGLGPERENRLHESSNTCQQVGTDS